MSVDLKSMSRKELEKLHADVTKAISQRAAREKKDALAAAEKAAKAHGFTLAEITNGLDAPKKTRKVVKKAKKPSAPKYANPADASQTWTGKGRQPEWFKAAISSGTSAEKLAI